MGFTSRLKAKEPKQTSEIAQPAHEKVSLLQKAKRLTAIAAFTVSATTVLSGCAVVGGAFDKGNATVHNYLLSSKPENTYLSEDSMFALNTEAVAVGQKTDQNVATYFQYAMIMQNVPLAQMQKTAGNAISNYNNTAFIGTQQYNDTSGSYNAINEGAGIAKRFSVLPAANITAQELFTYVNTNGLPENTAFLSRVVSPEIANYYYVTMLYYKTADYSPTTEVDFPWKATFNNVLKEKDCLIIIPSCPNEGSAFSLALIASRSTVGLPKGTSTYEAVQLNTATTEKIIHDAALLLRKEGADEFGKRIFPLKPLLSESAAEIYRMVHEQIGEEGRVANDIKNGAIALAAIAVAIPVVVVGVAIGRKYL